MKRYYVEGALGETFAVEGGEFNHMANVMRSKLGDEVIVCNGDGRDYRCEILEIGKRSATLRVLSSEVNEQEAQADVTAFVGLLKGDNTELVVQKLSELGLRRVVPFFSENTVAKADAKKIERFNRVALESAKQCGRAYAIKVEPAIPFREIFERKFDALFFCYEAEAATGIGRALARTALGNPPSVAFVVGSEGGFTPAEAAFASERASSVSLGKRILRAETASIAVGSTLMFVLGELGGRA